MGFINRAYVGKIALKRTIRRYVAFPKIVTSSLHFPLDRDAASIGTFHRVWVLATSWESKDGKIGNFADGNFAADARVIVAVIFVKCFSARERAITKLTQPSRFRAIHCSAVATLPSLYMHLNVCRAGYRVGGSRMVEASCVRSALTLHRRPPYIERREANIKRRRDLCETIA